MARSSHAGCFSPVKAAGRSRNFFGLTDMTERRISATQHSKNCEFCGETQAKAATKLNEWKKANARGVPIIAQIIGRPSADSDACVIRVEYENGE